MMISSDCQPRPLDVRPNPPDTEMPPQLLHHSQGQDLRTKTITMSYYQCELV
jgi:hypothetical protein